MYYNTTYITSNVPWCFCRFHWDCFSGEVITFLQQFFPSKFVQFLIWKARRVKKSSVYNRHFFHWRYISEYIFGIFECGTVKKLHKEHQIVLSFPLNSCAVIARAELNLMSEHFCWGWGGEWLSPLKYSSKDASKPFLQWLTPNLYCLIWQVLGHPPPIPQHCKKESCWLYDPAKQGSWSREMSQYQKWVTIAALIFAALAFSFSKGCCWNRRCFSQGEEALKKKASHHLFQLILVLPKEKSENLLQISFEVKSGDDLDIFGDPWEISVSVSPTLGFPCISFKGWREGSEISLKCCFR